MGVDVSRLTNSLSYGFAISSSVPPNVSAEAIAGMKTKFREIRKPKPENRRITLTDSRATGIIESQYVRDVQISRFNLGPMNLAQKKVVAQSKKAHDVGIGEVAKMIFRADETNYLVSSFSG